MLVNLGVQKTRRGHRIIEPTLSGTKRKVVIALDSRYVGHGNYTGTGLALMWELGLASPMISTAIRLTRMGFISKTSLLHFHREYIYSPATSSYIPRSASPERRS